MGKEHNGRRTADQRRQDALRAQSPRTNEANGVAGDPLLTVAEAGEYLGTGERFVRRLITERRISYVKLGKYVRLQRSILDAFIDAGRVPSQQWPAPNSPTALGRSRHGQEGSVRKR